MRPTGRYLQVGNYGAGEGTAQGRALRSAALNALICSRNEIGDIQVVPAVQQAGSARGVDRKSTSPFAAHDRLRFEIDRDRRRRLARQRRHQRAGLGLAYHRGKQSVLGRVLRKNIPERRRDHAADAVVVKRIDRGLARGAAAEIAPGHDNPCVTPAGPIEREVRPFVAGGVETQIVKQDLAVFALARQLEIARRQYLVGVDILGRERTDRGRDAGEFFHRRLPQSLRAGSDRISAR